MRAMTVQGVEDVVLTGVDVTAADWRRVVLGDVVAGTVVSVAVPVVFVGLALMTLMDAVWGGGGMGAIVVVVVLVLSLFALLFLTYAPRRCRALEFGGQIVLGPDGVRARRGGREEVRLWQDLAGARIGRGVAALGWRPTGVELIPVRYLSPGELLLLRGWIEAAGVKPRIVGGGPRALRDGCSPRAADCGPEPLLTGDPVVRARWRWTVAQALDPGLRRAGWHQGALVVLAGPLLILSVASASSGFSSPGPVALVLAAVLAVAPLAPRVVPRVRLQARETTSVEAGGDGFRISLGGGSYAVAWSEIRRVRIGRRAIVLSGEYLRLGLPADVLGADQRTALARLARDAGVDVRGG